MSLQLALLDHGCWVRGHRYTSEAAALADRHYSRRTPGDRQFMGPGRPLVLVTRCGLAVWGALEGKDPAGALRWRCSIFRNEGAGLSSRLIAEATAITFAWWRERYGALPAVRFSTEIDPGKVRRKRDPGRCFRRAGWTVRGWTAGGHGRSRLLVLDAPGEQERVP